MTAAVGGPGKFVGLVRTPCGGGVEVFIDPDRDRWMRVTDNEQRVALVYLSDPVRDLLIALLTDQTKRWTEVDS